MATQGVRAGRGKISRVVAKGAVKQEDRMSASQAASIFLQFANQIGATSDEDREDLLGILAVALCKGTSYRRKYQDISFEYGGGSEDLSTLLALMDKKYENDVRIWARSYEGFADLTSDVIRQNEWLRKDVANRYAVSYDIAHVCFDYADAMTYDLTPAERAAIVYNVDRMTTGSRSDFYESGFDNKQVAPSTLNVAKTAKPAAPAAVYSGGSAFGR